MTNIETFEEAYVDDDNVPVMDRTPGPTPGHGCRQPPALHLNLKLKVKCAAYGTRTLSAEELSLHRGLIAKARDGLSKTPPHSVESLGEV
jgi:hypothetical protein